MDGGGTRGSGIRGRGDEGNAGEHSSPLPGRGVVMSTESVRDTAGEHAVRAYGDGGTRERRENTVFPYRDGGYVENERQ